jgi:hypothetical protein
VDSEFDAVIVPSDGVSVSGSDSDHSDWSIGWFEPHSKHFTDDEEDTFAVLMPCYGSPAPPDAASRNSFSPSKGQKPPHLNQHNNQSLPGPVSPKSLTVRPQEPCAWPLQQFQFCGW